MVNLSGVVTEPGQLVIRGVKAQLSGGAMKEFLLPLSSDEDEGQAAKRKSILNCEVDRIKWSGLQARSSATALREKRLSIAKADATPSQGKGKESKFLTCKVIEEQPLLRVRRTTLSQGAVMLYEGET